MNIILNVDRDEWLFAASIGNLLMLLRDEECEEVKRNEMTICGAGHVSIHLNLHPVWTSLSSMFKSNHV